MSCEVKLRKGAYPVAVERTLRDQSGEPVNISGSSNNKIRLVSPSGVKKEFNAIFTNSGSDGKIRFVTSAATDLDEVGTWRAQFRLGISGGAIPSDDFTFQVGISLEAP
jgi:hypothetical protein